MTDEHKETAADYGEVVYDWTPLFDEQLDSMMNELHGLASDNRLPMVAHALRKESTEGRNQHSSGITLGKEPTPPNYYFYIAADKLANPVEFIMSWQSLMNIVDEATGHLVAWDASEEAKSIITGKVEAIEELCRENGVPLYIDVCFGSNGSGVSDRLVAEVKPKTGARLHYQEFFSKLGKNPDFFKEAEFEELFELLKSSSGDSESLVKSDAQGNA